MVDKTDFPYPAPYEAVRYIAKAFDLKHSEKFLDDKAYKRIFDQRELNKAIDQFIVEPLSKHVTEDIEKEISDILHRSFSDYLRLVGSLSADGVSRAEMIPLLNKFFINKYIAGFIEKILTIYTGLSFATLLDNNEPAISTALGWLEKNIPQWKKHIQSLEKTQKDRILMWRQGVDLPSSQSIILLAKADKHSIVDQWDKIKTLLFIARAIDFLKRESAAIDLIDEVRATLWGAMPVSKINKELEKIQDAARQQLAGMLPKIGELRQLLSRKSIKEKPEHSRELIDFLSEKFSESDVFNSTNYWLQWYEARWHVFSGDLQNAHDLYKSAFENCLFRSGDNQQKIIEEAVVVAASLKNPDKVFIKHLKWAMIAFQYDIPSVNSEESSNQFSDSVEGWEIERWRSGFKQMFPSDGWFPGAMYTDLDNQDGPLIVRDLNKIKPDYRHPDRKIKIGDSRQRIKPQLVWFTEIEDFDACTKLLESGADVNVYSEMGDTPILMALRALEIRLDKASLDDRFFWLISSKLHKPEIINMRTQQKRLLPIISAVESGRSDIVKKVLEMGADPNGRGLTDEQTALNVCLKRISQLRNPDKFLENQRRYEKQKPPAMLDAVRRAIPDVRTLEQANHVMSRITEHPASPVVNRLIHKRILQYMNIDNMLAIARLLIESGADVNAEHKSPINGYTPLMLAAANDEIELFELMLEHGGDPEKTYLWKDKNQYCNCWHIAQGFKSHKILNLRSHS